MQGCSTENRLLGTEGGTNGESIMDTRTLPFVKHRASGNLLYDSVSSSQGSVTTQRGGTAWEVGGRLQREGSHAYLWLIHVAVWQKPTQYCRAVILQFKVHFEKRKAKKYALTYPLRKP